MFLFNVTIQNHGGYEDEEYETTVQLTDYPGKFPQAEQYLSLTKKSDTALEFLLDYFARQPDPVVVVFFGALCRSCWGQTMMLSTLRP